MSSLSIMRKATSKFIMECCSWCMLTYKCITLILRVSEIHDKLYLDQQSQAYRQLCRNPGYIKPHLMGISESLKQNKS